MTKGTSIFAICVLCGVILSFFIPGFTRFDSVEEETEESTSSVDRKSPNAALPEKVAPRVMSADDIARVNELKKMEFAKLQEAQAAEKTREAREKLQLLKGPAWRKVILDNMKKFEALRVEAARAPDNRVPCTICDAKGVLPDCVICDHSGQCPTCQGSGRFFDEVCPTCQKNGKCFLCSGSGKMPCPFCQSSSLTMEVITPDTPTPSGDIPIGMPKVRKVEK